MVALDAWLSPAGANPAPALGPFADLRAALADVGRDPGAIVVRHVGSEEEAAAERFIGSPTIRIDGRDAFAPGDDEPYGLTCRIYHRRDGSVSPTPDPEDLRAVLAS